MECKPPTKVKVVEIKGKGLVVIATDKILKDEIIEICPLIMLSEEEANFIKSSDTNVLKFYILELTAINKHVLHLGYGLIYNHSFEPNADIEYVENTRFLIFRAIKDIIIDEEITYNYNFDNDLVEYLPLN